MLSNGVAYPAFHLISYSPYLLPFPHFFPVSRSLSSFSFFPISLWVRHWSISGRRSATISNNHFVSALSR